MHDYLRAISRLKFGPDVSSIEDSRGEKLGSGPIACALAAAEIPVSKRQVGQKHFLPLKRSGSYQGESKYQTTCASTISLIFSASRFESSWASDRAG